MDNIQELYRETFSHFGPSQKVRERILNLRTLQPSGKPHYIRRLSGLMAAAVLALALLGCAVVTATYGDSIQSWFAHYWEIIHHQPMSEGQTALIDHLTQDIGLSQTVGDVTVTVDSATVGDDSFFLLLRVEGLKFSSRNSYGFDTVDMALSPDPLEENSGLLGYGFQSHGLDTDGSVILMMDYDYAASSGFLPSTEPLTVTLTLSDLVQNAHTDRRKVLAEGTWDFTFTLDRSQIPNPIQLPDTVVPLLDEQKGEAVPVTLTHIEVTSTGIRFQYNCLHGNISIVERPIAVLDNGTEVSYSSGVGSVMEDGETLACSYHWSVPVNLDEVAYIRIEHTEIPVQ